MPERLPAYNPADDDPKPKAYEPYVDKEKAERDAVDATLARHNIQPPARPESRLSLAKFIENGLPVFGATPEIRAQALKKCQDEWLGKRVRTKQTGADGQVQAGQIQQISLAGQQKLNEFMVLERQGRLPVAVIPFRAYVRWDNGAYSLIDFTNLLFE